METEKIIRLDADKMGTMSVQEMLHRLPECSKHLDNFSSGWKWEEIDREDVTSGITDGWFEIHCELRDQHHRTLRGKFVQSHVRFMVYAIYNDDGDMHEVEECMSFDDAVFAAWVYMKRQSYHNKLCEDSCAKSIKTDQELAKQL
jgi:hypothetical protein